MGDPLPCVRIGESKRYVVVQRFCPFKRSRMPVTPLVFAVTISPVPAGLPEYDRRNWKHWTDADGDCQDARKEVLNQSQGGMCICRVLGIGAGVSRECFGP